MKVEREIAGEPSQVLFRAASLLTALGFELVERDAGKLVAKGPARVAVTQPPLLAAGNLQVEQKDGRVTVETDLSGDRIVYAFLALFPTVVMGGLNVLFNEDYSFGSLVIWPVVSIALLIWVRRQGRQAIKDFAERLASAVPD